jgi:hypothetical protein
MCLSGIALAKKLNINAYLSNSYFKEWESIDKFKLICKLEKTNEIN